MKIIPADRVIRVFEVCDPVAVVQDGEEFWVECRDCYDGQIRSANDRRSSLDISRLMPCTGPIAVDGAVPGSSLRIEVLAIEPAEQGFMPLKPGLGILGSQITEETTYVIPVDVPNRILRLGMFSVPLKPLIGTIGTTPRQPVPTAIPGDHGGNLDTREIREGASVYLPVFVPGGLLALGDLHAAQGDGELCGQGVEIPGKVKLRVHVCPENLLRPRVETEGSWITIASAPTLEEALRIAAADMVEFICHTYHVHFNEAYRLLSIAGNGGI
ncbi:MAG: acetamidase/formamidase family protein, partial [Anaerolineae bacterium]